jgi:sugar lactone lactonase YvrE
VVLQLGNAGDSSRRVAADFESNSEVMAHVPTTLPFSIDWLPDSRMIIVSGPEALLRREPDGALVTHADLSGLADAFNEIVVDSRGNAYVNGDIVTLVRPDGSARQVADDVAFGNGMAITEDGSTLIVAESWARRLSAFDIAADGGLSNRRVWADLGESPPDGICVDAEGRSGSPTCRTSVACACAKGARYCRRSG